MAADFKRPTLQQRVDDWLRRLADLPAPLDGYAAASWAPNNDTIPQWPSAAPHYLLDRLARRIEELYLGTDATRADHLLVLRDTAESGLFATINQEIVALERADLTGWTLAGLQLWAASANPALQKRSGSYYTSPELARYIVAQTLLADEPVTTVLDPACGGGAFLLATLERLHELAPNLPLSQLVVRRLYGVELNPLAVWLTRLAILARLSELADGPVAGWVYEALMIQVRVGNALVGPVGSPYTERLLEERLALFAAIERNDLSAARLWRTAWEQTLFPVQQEITRSIADLPIFNEPGDGPELARRSPFGWGSQFPEVAAAGGFGAVVGNPPYVGFNDYSGPEKAYFAQVFGPVYNLKSDLLYYFIMRGIELLGAGGRLGYVTSRFWKEAVFAAPLRRYLTAQTVLTAIEDLGDRQFFQAAQVDVCLLFAQKQPPPPDHRFPFRYAGREEWVAQAQLTAGAPWAWLRRLPTERLVLEKIAAQSVPLGKLARCRTGVQTGLDEVFFLTTAQVTALGLEATVLKRAIKNRDIGPGRADWMGLWMIYPSVELDLEDWPNLKQWLESHRARLDLRRRYDTAFPFWQLQWPREPGLFEVPCKLVTPYKARRNTFALDRAQLYFSTDVISVVFEPGWVGEQLAANFLNSSLSTFQFRSFGKPMGGGQWDYYANPVKRLAFPALGKLTPPPTRLNETGLTQPELDDLVFEWYGLNRAEQDLIISGVQND